MRNAEKSSFLEETCSFFERKCFESLPLLPLPLAHPRKLAALAQETANSDSQPTQAALNLALITNILLLGVPVIIKEISNTLKSSLKTAPPLLIAIFYIAVSFVLEASCVTISIVPKFILIFFELFSNHASESAKDQPIEENTTASLSPNN